MKVVTSFVKQETRLGFNHHQSKVFMGSISTNDRASPSSIFYSYLVLEKPTVVVLCIKVWLTLILCRNLLH